MNGANVMTMGLRPICKHMSVLKMIVDEELPYLLNLLLNICESNGFMDPLNTNKA